MDKILIIILLMLTSCAFTEQQSEKEMVQLPLLHIQPAIYDLGEVKEGEEAVATFLVRNNSAEVMNLVDIQASCGCTVAKPDSYSIPPYGFTQLKVAVDSTAKQDHIKKTISIVDAAGHQGSAMLVFSVIANPHAMRQRKVKGIFDGKCAACHFTPVLQKRKGEDIYNAACLMCHGEQGQGAYAPRLQGYGSLAALKHVITNGVGKPQMPAFSDQLGGPLQAVQIEALADWLMSLPKHK